MTEVKKREKFFNNSLVIIFFFFFLNIVTQKDFTNYLRQEIQAEFQGKTNYTLSQFMAENKKKMIIIKSMNILYSENNKF